MIAGTSEVVGVSRKAGERVSGLLKSPRNILNVHPGLELHYGPTQAGGICIDWLTRLLSKSSSEILSMLHQLEIKQPSSIVFRPYLYGERAPYWNHELCAGFDGFRAEHGIVDVVHAVLQGIALQERLIIDLAERGRPVEVVALGGGATRSETWNRIRADILQRKVLVLADSEVSLRGAAMVAWGHPLTGTSKPWFTGEVIYPNTSYAACTDALMRRFKI